MSIEKVFGLEGTGVPLHERFTQFSAAADLATLAAKRHALRIQTLNRIREARMRRQRLQNLQSVNNLENVAAKQNNARLGQSPYIFRNNFNQYRPMARGGLSAFAMRRRLWQRGVGMQLRHRFNNGMMRKQVARRSRPFLGMRGRGQRNYAAGQQMSQPQRRQVARRGRPFLRGRGIGRGGIPRPLPSKEQLDQELEEYMSTSRAALDKQLDEYMAEAEIQLDIVI